MKLRSILTEAGLNLSLGTSRATLFTILLTGTMTALAVADIATITTITQQAHRFRTTGGSTLIYQLPNGINGTACDGLARTPGVIAAGAIRRNLRSETAATLPAEQIPTFDITPAFGNFTALGTNRVTNGIAITANLAQTLGLQIGSQLTLIGGTTTVGTIFDYPDDGRRPGYGYGIYLPTNSNQLFDECWAEAWPVTPGLRSLLSATLAPRPQPTSNEQPPKFQQLNSTHGTSYDGKAIFTNRLTRYAPIIAAIITALLGSTAIWLRRLEISSALHAKITTPAITLQTVIETTAWTITATILTLATITTWLTLNPTPGAHEAFPHGIRVITVAAATTILAALLTTLLIKERHLFRYFRTQ
ncbi:MAG: hypothetical protein B5766_04620 [Candidatus Lumbricidophila eiseniae]|uniref:MacB-like periplasmic core domain-containing protein n=1 Tax=Candidatus Lumbricidiphila eiseniae TaxID=1969409 RepID=A0A2A6FTI9_9MICO|nr:MAG: hypothetical protein B5766_04620 [Candidatus Lumbricidophila eiseniae]